MSREGELVETARSSSPEGHLLQQVGVHLLSSSAFGMGVLLHGRREERGGARWREEVGIIPRLPDGHIQRVLERNSHLVCVVISHDSTGRQPELPSLSPPGRERRAPARCLRPGPIRCRPGRHPGWRPSAGPAGRTGPSRRCSWTSGAALTRTDAHWGYNNRQAGHSMS